MADESGRPYVVVSADAHAAPDDLDAFLSYVDPAHRDAVATFGDLSSTAMSMLGGTDPGPIDDPDPVRATAARRLAGMGVDINAAAEWLANYSEDWVFAGDADGKRLAVLEEQGIQAEVSYPGPILAGGISPAMYLGSATADGLDVVRAISTRAVALLRPGGTLVLEHGELQGAAIRELLAADGWRAAATYRDLLGRDRTTTATL